MSYEVVALCSEIVGIEEGSPMLRALIATLAVTSLSTPVVVATVPTGRQPCGATAYRSSFYVDNYAAGTIARIDPRTNKVIKRGDVGSGPCGVVGGAGSLWVENYHSSTIARVNPATLKVIKQIKVGIQPWDVTYGFGAVWS